MYRITEKLPTVSRQQNISLFLQHQNTPTILRNFRRHYDTGLPRKKAGIGKPLFYTVATAAAISGGAITYAKFNDKFRKQLIDNVPGSGALIKFAFSNEKSSTEKFAFSNEKSSTKNPVVNSVKSINKESRTSPSRIKSESVVTKEKEDYKKYNMAELEKETKDATLSAINGYNTALKNLKEYREEIVNLIERSVRNEDQNIWFRIKEKTEQKDKFLESVENKGHEAMQKIEHLKLLINDPKTNLEPEVKTEIENRIKNVLNDLVFNKALFNQEKTYSSAADTFSKKVEESKQVLFKELGILFPSVLIESDMIISEESLNLFILYSCQLVNFYQKELQKSETLGKAKIDKCIELSKAENPDMIKEVIDIETDKIRRESALEVLKKELNLKGEFEKELRAQIRRQAEVHTDHIEEIVELKNKEMERQLKQNVNEQVEKMRINYNRQLARIIGRMKGLDIALRKKAISEREAKHSQLLWNACQSLILTLKSGTNTKSWEDQLKPLENQVNAISKAAAEEDIFVCAIVNAIPEEAKKRGVFSELALKDRFLNVERIAYRVANLPEGFVSLPKIFLSYLQSFLLIKTSKPIPPEELMNEPFDVSSLDNYDILNRARYWLDRGDFEQCLKYMNLLKGVSRAIANEWMNETRIFLETQQAANLLLSHAVYSSLVYLQNSS